MAPVRLPGTRPSELEIVAVTGGGPTASSTGKVTRVPEPTTALIELAATPASTTATISHAVMPASPRGCHSRLMRARTLSGAGQATDARGPAAAGPLPCDAPARSTGADDGRRTAMDVRLVTPDGVQRCPPDQLGAALRRQDGFVWVDLPVGDPDTERVLLEVFGFHPRAVHDCLQRNALPKAHVYDDHLLVVLHGPERGEGGHVHYLELDQLVSSRYLVTVHGPITPAVDPAAALRETGQVAARLDAGRLRPASPHALSSSIVSALASRMRDDLAERTTEVWRCEQEVTAGELGDAEQFLDDMFRVRHGLLAIRTIAGLSHQIYGRMHALDAYGE